MDITQSGETLTADYWGLNKYRDYSNGYLRMDVEMNGYQVSRIMRCDIKDSDGRCLNIINEADGCYSRFEEGGMPLDEDFYYDTEETVECPDGSSNTCTEYCNSIYDECVVANSYDQIVKMETQNRNMLLYWMNDPVTLDLFAVKNCNGTDIPAPVIDPCVNTSSSSSSIPSTSSSTHPTPSSSSHPHSSGSSSSTHPTPSSSSHPHPSGSSSSTHPTPSSSSHPHPSASSSSTHPTPSSSTHHSSGVVPSFPLSPSSDSNDNSPVVIGVGITLVAIALVCVVVLLVVAYKKHMWCFKPAGSFESIKDPLLQPEEKEIADVGSM